MESMGGKNEMTKHESNLVNALSEIAKKKPTSLLDIVKIVVGYCGDNVKSITLKGEKRVSGEDLKSGTMS